MTGCVIFSGGLFMVTPEILKVINEADYLICADGGARHAECAGVTPDLVIGDFDTLSPEEMESLAGQGIELVRLPRDKDYSDTHLALLKALELGYKKITMLACLGGRADHALANIMLLALPAARDIDLRIMDEQQEVFLIHRRRSVKGKAGDTLSLLPLSEKVTGIKTEGLLYQVPHGMFQMGIPNGISNSMLAPEVSIEVEEGLLVGVHLLK